MTTLAPAPSAEGTKDERIRRVETVMKIPKLELRIFFCSGVYIPDYDNCSNVQYVNKQPRRLGKSDFGSGRDLNHLPPPHDSSSGGDSATHLSAIPSVSFRCNSFTIRRPSPMLVQKMSKIRPW